MFAKKRTNGLIILFIGLLGVGACTAGASSSTSQSTPPTFIASTSTVAGVSDTATSVAIGTQDVNALYSHDVENFVQRYEVNLQCTPLCWSSFVPGTTPMSDVFDLLAKLTSSSGYSSSKGDPKAPQNTTGISEGDVEISAFSDSTQPDPKLRAFYLGMAFPINTPGVDPQLDAWLPQNVVQHFGKPSTVSIADYPKGYYYLLFDYQGWAVQYKGIESAIQGNTQLMICPSARLPSIYIWLYSKTEPDAFTMIESLKTYDNASSITGLSTLDRSKLTSVNDPSKIDALIGQLNQSACISPTLK